MRKLFLPFLFDENSFVQKENHCSLFCDDAIPAYNTLDEAVQAGKTLAMKNPKGKVVIFEAIRTLEPRRVEFSEKVYTANGELHAA